MSDELKPCKQCGGHGKLMDNPYPDGTTDYWVYCRNEFCFYETPSFDTPEKAIEVWNEPSDEQKLRAELQTAQDNLATKDSEIAYLKMVIDNVTLVMVEFADALMRAKERK